MSSFEVNFSRLTLSKTKNTRDIPNDPDHKLVLLAPEVGTDPKDFPKQLSSFIAEKKLETSSTEVSAGFDEMSAEEVLRRLLPADVQVPSGFEHVGHIVHMNLSEGQRKYLHEIGEVLLAKNPAVRTVINKVGFITNTFRTFDYELMAGEGDSLETVHVEDKLQFALDVGTVYWCSRLQTERQRLIKRFHKGEVLCDMFCGIGPLAIKAAKHAGLRVLANDLNPECYKYLRTNIIKNKVAEAGKARNQHAFRSCAV